jgi:hypothetical protein
MDWGDTVSHLFHILLRLGAGFDIQEAANYGRLPEERRTVIISQKCDVKEGSLERRDRLVRNDRIIRESGCYEIA